MTKMIKMSLIAAVAVTGMTSTVCAQPLEDAIKGVDVSGMMRYRYNDTKVDSQDNTKDLNTQNNEYTAKIALKSKVNDMITANVQVEALGVSDISSSDTHATTDATGDRDVTLSITKANFAANLGFATVVAGKQSVPSPFVDGNAATDDVTRGTGAVALIPAGPVTIAAGHFMNFQVAEKDVNLGNSIDAAAVIGSVAGVNADLWYVKVNGVTGGLVDTTGTSLGLNTTIGGITLDARHSETKRTGSKDSGLTKLVASTKVGPVSLTAGAAMTPKDNSNVTIDSDNDAKVGFRLWQASTEKLDNSTAYLVGAKMQVMPGVTLSADYVTAEADVPAVAAVAAVTAVPYTLSATGAITGTTAVAAKAAVDAQKVDITETLFGATYAMSKNFSVHARYSMMTTKYSGVTKDVDSNSGRLELKYTF